MKRSNESIRSKSRDQSPPQLNLEKGLQDEGNKAAFLKIRFADLSNILSNEPNLEKLIEATGISARNQIRKTYRKKLLRPETITAALPESRLERSLWLLWGLHKSCRENPEFLTECPHIVSYQLPLYNRRSKKDRDGWGKIDVVGLAKNLTPVVIELKAGSSDESLLRMVLEAVAYGIAIQTAWRPRFLLDWKYALKELASADDRLINQQSLKRLPATLNTCLILCAAPSEYWDAHIGDSKSEEFKAILGHLNKKGFPVSFAKLDFAGKPFTP